MRLKLGRKRRRTRFRATFLCERFCARRLRCGKKIIETVERVGAKTKREREREERLYAIINTQSKMAEVETEWLMTSLPAFFRPLCRLIMSCPIERSETLSVWKASTCERKWTLRHEAIKKWLAFKTRPVTFLCLFVFWRRRRRSFFCSNRVFRLEEDLQGCNWVTFGVVLIKKESFYQCNNDLIRFNLSGFLSIYHLPFSSWYNKRGLF